MERLIKVAAITENWLVDNSCTSLANVNYIGKNRDDGFCGVDLYIDRKIKYNIVQYDSQFDILIIPTLNLKKNVNCGCNLIEEALLYGYYVVIIMLSQGYGELVKKMINVLY